ncbi:hypothetical protein [Maribacter dokdonensis]|uniref:hypothetical protein n=1 Tax=Maribacter dokdonensis TaxID=320912 RepID=UPI0027347B34|nr:hypothetical protein [Maribacter dokdonensis]MDP2527925.1 hypothetical protein [Maribacter dokdonensis]
MTKQASYIFSSKLKLIKKSSLFIFLTFFLLLLAFEFYNPLAKTRSNTTEQFQNNFIPELPKTIKIKYNNINYLGENFSDTIKRDKVIFLGSSTTQSFYVPESYKWTTFAMNNFNFWYNNCGVDGLKIKKLKTEIQKTKFIKPTYTIILFDPFNNNDLTVSEDFKPDIKQYIKKINLFKSVILPFIKSKENSNIGHRKINWANEEKTLNNQTVNTRKPNSLITEKLNEIKTSIVLNNSIPIFISAPTPYGNYINNNGIDISKIKNSISIDQEYKIFNDEMKKACKNLDIKFIDGYSLQKNTDLFYDATHFNLEGSEQFGLLINEKLKLIMK